MSIEVLKQALTDAKRNERHNNVAETRYWLNQYKLIAEQAIADLESQEHNFCPRCGKRTADLTVIHTCTPPQRTVLQPKEIARPESAKVKDYNRGWNDCLFASGIVKQSQRTWVGLTDEEAKKIETIMIYGNWSFLKIIKDIEAKLKQKNGYAEENT
jgi:hypothetical protein